MKKNEFFETAELHETLKKLECLGDLSYLPIAKCVKIPCDGISQKVLKWWIDGMAKSQNKCFVLERVGNDFAINRLPDDCNAEIFYKYAKMPNGRIVGNEAAE